MNLLITVTPYDLHSTDIVNMLLQNYQPENAYLITTNGDASKIKYPLKASFARMEFAEDADYSRCIGFSKRPPLDERIIIPMRQYEPQIMKMLERNQEYTLALKGASLVGRSNIPTTLSYDLRKRLYYRHLRYWDYFLTEYKIDAVVFIDKPHGIFNNVIYGLCEIKNIAKVLSEKLYPFGRFFYSNIEIPLPLFAVEYEKAARKFETVSTASIPLPPKIEAFWKKHTEPGEDKTPYQMKKSWLFPFLNPKRVLSSIIQDKRYALQRTKYHIKQGVASMVKVQMCRELIRIYDKLTVSADYTVPYIYFPLHRQPEATSNPMGGIFVDQLLAIEMIASSLPPNTMLYVKEHPQQHKFGYGRDASFYADIAKLPNVRLVPRNTDTYKLITHCSAVASLTGTVGLEALMMEKPFIMFGFNPYMYAKGTFHIRTTDECRDAVDFIFKHGARHTLRDMRMYFYTLSKVISDCGIAPPHLNGINDAELIANGLSAALDVQIKN